MIIYVNPMWSVQTINSDSNYVFLSSVITKFNEKYPEYSFLMPFPASKGFRYYDDGFFKLPNILRIPHNIPQGKKQNNIHFDTFFIKKIYDTYGPYLIWNQIPELAPQLKYFMANFHMVPTVINQHHYILHESLPYPLEPNLHFVFMQLCGDYCADVNLFNSDHCWNMTLDNIREYLPSLEKKISEKRKVLKFGFFDKNYKYKNTEKYEKFTFIFNHRFQDYKNWRTTFEIFDQLYAEKHEFNVLVTKAGGDRINIINEKPYVMVKDLPTKQLYLDEIPKCHANTFNSQHETFCISILESMFYGLSTIVPNRTTMPELLGKDNWQLFNTENEQKEKLIHLINNKDVNEKYGKQNQERAKTFNVDDYVDKLHELFQSQIRKTVFTGMKDHNKQGFLKVINNRSELELHDVEKMIRDCGLSKTQSMPMFKANLALYELGYRQKFNKNKAFWLKMK